MKKSHSCTHLFGLNKEIDSSTEFDSYVTKPLTEDGAPRDLTVPTSLGVPHCGVGVNSGRKVGGNAPMTPEANSCT